ncbi:GH1 family beta-glucosidase [Maribacter flavus]|uniref:Beta-glucosidase n=1 Tax=Maribacter flavus TaxID=1658664 RepID=A0A5B2TWX3_9FLAO|nr:GH1 family beta-glucosidase [Maribacter flavus]KAA2218789.1 beta-glucosidase [Maribacter flavus]
MTKKIHSSDFGKNFIWGVSTAAFQIEGAHDKHGKGPSIWDVFTSRKGKIRGNDTAKTSCDFYHRYKEDIDLMKSLNIPNFRFSISWSRILPTGTGKINTEGIAFYNRVIDYCLEQDITPWITLYHWDLPHELELKGGWTNREILDWFEEYTKVCAQSFGDRVKHWMVLNEPMVFTGGGYFLGVHAPGKKGMRNFLPAVHHAQLSQAVGGRMIRKWIHDAKIGTTYSCSYIVPKNKSPRNIRAAKRVDALLNRLFIEPVLGLGYPEKDLPILIKLKPFILPGDMGKSQFEFDFIGIQNYTREVVQHSYFIPYIKAKIIEAPKRKVITTLMDWEVYPPSIYEMIRKYSEYCTMPNLIITENGAAFQDTFTEGKIKDKKRQKFLKDHLEQVLKAKKKGLNVHGYFVWTLTDNFEWAEGYHPGFGLVHVDFKTQKRTVKKSGKWYKNFLKDS